MGICEKVQIAICDDEREIRDKYAEKIRQMYPYIDLVLYSSGETLLRADRQPDVLLLDIQLQGRNGMEVARYLRKRSKDIVIIFVSAFEDYVFEAFDVGAFHYLVKPFDNTKFEEVLTRAVRQYEEKKKCMAEERQTPTLLIKRGGEYITVKIEDILYAEVFNRKVILHMMDSDIEYYGKMKDLEKEAGVDFYRSHRAYLVNFNFVRKYNAKTIYLERGQALMAKQNYQEFVRNYLRYVFDVSVILNNALKNAVEYTAKQGTLSIRSYHRNNAYIIEIKNSFLGSVVWDVKSNLPVTSKEKMDGHGYGLSNMRKVAAKYAGDIAVDVKDGEFCLNVMFISETIEIS